MNKFILSLILLFALSACGGGETPYPSFNDIPDFENNVPNEGSSGTTSGDTSPGTSITLENGELLTSATLNDILDVTMLGNITLDVMIAILQGSPQPQCDNDSTLSVHELTNNAGEKTISILLGSNKNDDSPTIYCQMNGYSLLGSIFVNNYYYDYSEELNGDWALKATIFPTADILINQNTIKRISTSNAIHFSASFINNPGEPIQKIKSQTIMTLALQGALTIEKKDLTTGRRFYLNQFKPGQKADLFIETTRTPNSFPDGSIAYFQLATNSISANDIVIDPATRSTSWLDVDATGISGNPLAWYDANNSPSGGNLNIEDPNNSNSIIMSLSYVQGGDHSIDLQINTTTRINTTWTPLLEKARLLTP